MVKVILLIFYSGTKTRRFWRELHLHSYIFSRWIPPSWKQRRSVCQNLFHETSPDDEQTITQCSNNKDNFRETRLFKWYPQSYGGNFDYHFLLKFLLLLKVFGHHLELQKNTFLAFLAQVRLPFDKVGKEIRLPIFYNQTPCLLLSFKRKILRGYGA